jgi:hypothetical protein
MDDYSSEQPIHRHFPGKSAGILAKVGKPRFASLTEDNGLRGVEEQQ